MPSTKDAGRPGSSQPAQLPLPSAPKFDRYGMHAHECECARCGLGFRPSIAERDAARRSWERMEKRRADAVAQAAAGTKEGKASRRKAAWAEAEKYTDQIIGRLTAPVERPATPEELAALKREFPNLTTKRKDRP